MKKFIKLMASDLLLEMIEGGYHREFSLLTIIALRAKNKSSLLNDGLEIGQALLGDYSRYGMTRQEFRTSISRLKKWKIVTIKTTTKGTIVTLSGSSVYDVDWGGEQPSLQPTNNQRVTTNREIRDKKKEKINKKENEKWLDWSDRFPHLLDSDFTSLLREHSKGKKVNCSDRAFELRLKSLKSFPLSQAKSLIERSIEKGYQGVVYDSDKPQNQKEKYITKMGPLGVVRTKVV